MYSETNMSSHRSQWKRDTIIPASELSVARRGIKVSAFFSYFKTAAGAPHQGAAAIIVNEGVCKKISYHS